MTENNSIPYCAREMVNYIEERLMSAEYSPGKRLPSIRRFAGKFKISYGSAARAINYLCSCGFLEKKTKSGVFVRRSSMPLPKNGDLRIMFFAHTNLNDKNSSTHSMCYTSLLSIQKRCLKLGHALSTIPLPYKGRDESLRIIRDYSKDADGIILFHEYDAYWDEYSTNKPTVGIMMSNNYSGTISTVNIDPYLAAEQAVRYFKNKNCKKLRAIYYNWPIYLERASIFQSVAVRNGLDCRLMEEGGRVRWDSNTGYYFASDQVLDRYSKKFEKKNGKTLAEAYCVLGIDGKSKLDPDFHDFPTIVANWDEIGKSALDECLSRINNPGSSPRRIYFPGQLKE